MRTHILRVLGIMQGGSKEAIILPFEKPKSEHLTSSEIWGVARGKELVKIRMDHADGCVTCLNRLQKLRNRRRFAE